MIHLIKLCVGVESVDQLEAYREQSRLLGHGRPDGLSVHRTRMMPKRADEIVGHGSLYWVIKGAVRARQPIVGLEKVTEEDGRNYCDILMSPEIIRTVRLAKRPFQGWRYLQPENAPRDLTGSVTEDTAEIQNELARLGLL